MFPPCPTRTACLAMLGLLVPAAVANPLDEELSEVVVIAPEPRYVAPTTRDRIGRVWVPVHIGEQGPFRLVLDTGALRSAVTFDTARRLGIGLDSTPPVRLQGVTGTAIAPTIPVDSLRVGDLWVGPSHLPVLDNVFGGAEGLLGVDGMQRHRIVISFRRDAIEIARSSNRPASRDFTVVPLMADAGELLAVQADVGGVLVRAIIDTGAQATVGNLALQSALRRQVQRNVLGEDVVHGTTGDIQGGLGVNVPLVRLGPLSVRNAHVTFSDLHIFDNWNLADSPALLIGMDIIGLLDTLVIDYRRRELHFRPRRQG